MAKATATIAVMERPAIHGRPAPLNLMAATSHGVRLVWTVRRETTNEAGPDAYRREDIERSTETVSCGRVLHSSAHALLLHTRGLPVVHGIEITKTTAGDDDHAFVPLQPPWQDQRAKG